MIIFREMSSVYNCFFRRHVSLSNLKHTPSRELPLTARKTVLSHLKRVKSGGEIREKRDTVRVIRGSTVSCSFK